MKKFITSIMVVIVAVSPIAAQARRSAIRHPTALIEQFYRECRPVADIPLEARARRVAQLCNGRIIVPNDGGECQRINVHSADDYVQLLQRLPYDGQIANESHGLLSFGRFGLWWHC